MVIMDAAGQLERVLKSSGVKMEEGLAKEVTVNRREFQKRLRETLVAEKISSVELADYVRIYFSKEGPRFENGLVACDPPDDSAV